MIPGIPVQLARVLSLPALQKKPHIYGGTTLPKDPKRRAKRVKRYADRHPMRDEN